MGYGLFLFAEGTWGSWLGRGEYGQGGLMGAEGSKYAKSNGSKSLNDFSNYFRDIC